MASAAPMKMKKKARVADYGQQDLFDIGGFG